MDKELNDALIEAADREHIDIPRFGDFDDFYHWRQFGPPTRNQAIISHLAWTWKSFAHEAQTPPPNTATMRSHFLFNASIALEQLLRDEKLPPHVDSWNTVLALRVIAKEMDGSNNRKTAAQNIRNYAVHCVNLVRTEDGLKDISIKEAYNIVFDALDNNCRDISNVRSISTLKHWDMQKNNPASKSRVEEVAPLPVSFADRESFQNYVGRMMSILGTIYSHHKKPKG